MTRTRAAQGKLAVTEVAIDQLVPNPWNPNRLSDEMRAKLLHYIEREGFVEPLVVRVFGDSYQIIGGFHRWGIAKSLGYETVPCVVVDVDDRRAKILSINLNEMKGQSLPALLAALVHDLTKELTLDDLELQLPYSMDELNDSLALLKVPAGLDAMLEAEAARQKEHRPTILTFVVEDEATIEKAIETAKRTAGVTTRGRALELLAKHYLESHE